MNIVVRELYANKKSLLIWGASMAAFVVMMFMEFAAYYKNPDMLALLDAMPPALLEAFGMMGTDLTTVSGYLVVAAVFVNVILSVYATMLGNGLLAKEERDKTTGFLMTLPLSRHRIITGKLVAGVLCCTILLAVTAASVLLALLPYEVEANFASFAGLLLATSWLTMIIFLTIGMLLAAITRRHKLSSGIGLGLVFALYIASVLAGLTESMQFLKYVTPFKYFEAATFLTDLSVEPLYLAITALVIVSATAGTYYFYSHRDL